MRCIELPRYRASLGSQRHHRTSHYAPPQWVRSVIDGRRKPHPSKRLPTHQRRIDIQLLDRAQRPPLLGHRAPPHTPCQEPRRLVGTVPTPPNLLRENERESHPPSTEPPNNNNRSGAVPQAKHMDHITRSRRGTPTITRRVGYACSCSFFLVRCRRRCSCCPPWSFVHPACHGPLK